MPVVRTTANAVYLATHSRTAHRLVLDVAAPRAAVVQMLAKKGGEGGKGKRTPTHENTAVPDEADAAEAIPIPEVNGAEVAAAPAAPVDDGSDPIFLLPEGAISLRVGGMRAAAPTYKDVLVAIEKVGETEEDMALFVAANRDLVDFRFLYKMTAQLLRAHNLGDAELSATLRGLRARVVKAAQRFDAPLFRELSEAEGRLGQVLAMQMQGEEVPPATLVTAAGSAPREIFGFWLVICSAIAAWELKLDEPKTADMASNKIKELQVILDVIESGSLAEAGAFGIFPALMRLPSQLLEGADHAAAQALLEELQPDSDLALLEIRRLGCLTCQAHRHAFQAYNPMTHKAGALYDILLRSKLVFLENEDIALPERTEYKSRIAQDAARFEEQNLVKPELRQLFW